jgi:hypothetical protein
MKLYQILFQNEAAKSVPQALNAKLAAVVSTGYGAHRVVLIDTETTLKTLQNFPTNNGEIAANRIVDADSVVAEVAWSTSNSELSRVVSSAGIDKYGPLCYQLVMYRISPGWLRSDTSLSVGEHGSQNVWNKMYELSNSGVYERKWVGDFSNPANQISDSAGVSYEELYKYLDILYLKAKSDPEVLTEEYFLDWLADNGKKPKHFGQFWAYKMSSHDPQTSYLFERGKEFMVELDKLLDEQGINVKSAAAFIDRIGAEFFSRLYGAD